MSDIENIVELFPERAKEIRQYYGAVGIFREICQDYFEASQAYDYWRSRGGERNKIIIEGYRSLLVELEDEILQTLERHISEVEGNR